MPRAFTATPDSRRQYYPAILSNGADAVLVSYAGASVSALTGHSHFEQHQNTPCGWFRAGHSGKMQGTCQTLYPVFAPGYNIIVNGEVSEPDFYSQEFDPEKALLKTRVCCWGVECEIESFLTDDNILAESYTITKTPDMQADLEFYLYTDGWHANRYATGEESEWRSRKSGGDAVDFSFTHFGIRGKAFMRVVKEKCKAECECREGRLFFKNVSAGARFSRLTFVADETNGKGWRKKFREKSKGLSAAKFSRIRKITWRFGINFPQLRE